MEGHKLKEQIDEQKYLINEQLSKMEKMVFEKKKAQILAESL